MAKNGKVRLFPLNDEAFEFLLRKRRLINSKYVFVSTNNNPLKDIDRRAFNRATEICNIEDFHFHDLRHTWASLARSKRNTSFYTTRIGWLGNVGNDKKIRSLKR